MSPPAPRTRGLSGIFGPSAASGRTRSTARQPEDRRQPSSTGPHAVREPVPEPGTGGRIVVRDPRQVDMLLLAALHGTPRTRGEAVEIIRERTRGRLVPIREEVPRRLGYLERNRLVCRSGDGRRFRSTELGDRVLLGRLRELGSLIDAVDALLGGEGVS